MDSASLLRRPTANQGFQSYLALGEIADCEHEFGGDASVSHLGDATWRDPKMSGERGETSAFCLKPCFEVHAASLDQPKPGCQGFSKPRPSSLCAMDAITQHRKKRLEQLISGAPYHGDRSAFMEATGLSKGRVSQLLDPEDQFGELAAARLCKMLDLAEGWFEQGAPGKPMAWPFVLLTPQLAASLTKPKRETVEKLALYFLNLGEAPALSELSYAHTQAPLANTHMPKKPRKLVTKQATFKMPKKEQRGTGSKSEGKPPRRLRGV